MFQKINEKQQVINDYESGRAIPNNQVMGKLERALGEFTWNLEGFSKTEKQTKQKNNRWVMYTRVLAATLKKNLLCTTLQWLIVFRDCTWQTELGNLMKI